MNVHQVSLGQPVAMAHFSGTENNAADRNSDSGATRGSTDANVGTQSEIIYKSGTVTPPSDILTISAREQLVEGYANRVVENINAIEQGSEGDRNINFQNVRLFMEPSGYFSGGLLAAGLDPHETFTVKFDTYVGMGNSKTLSSSENRTYFAWEVAAGALAHDKVAPGGVINFHDMIIEAKDRGKVKDLETVGQSLQTHWENEICAPMRDASGVLAQRSGKADAYVVRATLQSLSTDQQRFEQLSPEGQATVKRTLDRNGEVIIPNVYGYPLSGYTFVPYTPYDGNYVHRPNEGMMIDLKNGTLREIHGDDDFAAWAQNNRTSLLRSFNAHDRQGGLDAHRPKAQHVLDSLILGHTSNYPGDYSLLADQQIDARETFNFTRARGGDYQLKHGDLNSGIALKYQTLNANIAVWSDQTEVFGSSQQHWKMAKDLWGNTFGYAPVTGNAGNVVFGAHDSLHGMTADDRIGGNSAAVLSALQVAHELASDGKEFVLGERSSGAAGAKSYRWSHQPQTQDFEFVRDPVAAAEKGGDTVLATHQAAVKLAPGSDFAVPFPGMREVMYN